MLLSLSLYVFSFRNYRCLISFKHCLTSHWRITTFSVVVFPFTSGREVQLIWKKGLKNSSQTTRIVLDTLLLASSKVLSKWTRIRRHSLFSSTLHFIMFPLQKDISEWKEKTEERHIYICGIHIYTSICMPVRMCNVSEKAELVGRALSTLKAIVIATLADSCHTRCW